MASKAFALFEPDPELRLPPLYMHMASTLPIQVLIQKLHIVREKKLGEDE